jgi:hypothetical protein
MQADRAMSCLPLEVNSISIRVAEGARIIGNLSGLEYNAAPQVKALVIAQLGALPGYNAPVV